MTARDPWWPYDCPPPYLSFRVQCSMQTRRTWRRRERRRKRGERQVQQLAAELGVTLPAVRTVELPPADSGRER